MHVVLCRREQSRAEQQAPRRVARVCDDCSLDGLHKVLTWLDGDPDAQRPNRRVTRGTICARMEKEFEDIDSSRGWQNLYNVSRGTGPFVFL